MTTCIKLPPLRTPAIAHHLPPHAILGEQAIRDLSNAWKLDVQNSIDKNATQLYYTLEAAEEYLKLNMDNLAVVITSRYGVQTHSLRCEGVQHGYLLARVNLKGSDTLGKTQVRRAQSGKQNAQRMIALAVFNTLQGEIINSNYEFRNLHRGQIMGAMLQSYSTAKGRTPINPNGYIGYQTHGVTYSQAFYNRGLIEINETEDKHWLIEVDPLQRDDYFKLFSADEKHINYYLQDNPLTSALYMHLIGKGLNPVKLYRAEFLGTEVVELDDGKRYVSCMVVKDNSSNKNLSDYTRLDQLTDLTTRL